MWRNNELWSDWPSQQRAKVLHKGSDLSSSSDSCPASRGFVDGPEDFEKMIKPPSPRQVHPVLEKGDLKFHNLHHLIQSNNGNSGNNSYILAQPPSGKKKSSTLPACDDSGGGTGGGSFSSDNKCIGGSGTLSQDGCHFIRVNSGRIELVSKDSWKTNSSGGGDHSGNSPSNNSAAERFLNRHHLKNDVRHSWCGSAIRPQQKIGDVPQQQQSKRLSEDQQYSLSGGGFRTGLGTNNNNNRIYPQEDITTTIAASEGHHYHLVQSDVDGENTMIVTTTTSTTATTIPAAYTSTYSAADEIATSTTNGKGLLSPLRERLAAIEELTTSLQSWQITEKTEYEKCVSDLANQVSRAVALQQMMKSEVEKLQQRVVDLENHNKAMATMIIPTLMKLHDTVGISEGPQLKSIEPAPNPCDDYETREEPHSTTAPMTSSSTDILQTDYRSLMKSDEIKESLSPSCDSNDHPTRSHINNSTSTASSTLGSINSSPSHFIAVVSTSSTPSSASSGYHSTQNASSQMKTICYEQTPIIPNPGESTAGGGSKGKITRTASSELQPLSSSAHSNPAMTCSTPVTSLRSPVKAPRTSRAVAAAAAAAANASQIPKMNSSSGNITGSSSSSLSRSNSTSSRYNQQLQSSNNPSSGAIPLIEHEPSLKRDENPNQSQIATEHNLITSLDSSITSSSYSTTCAGPINTEMSRSVPPRSSCRTTSKSNNCNNSQSNGSNSTRASLSGIPRMSSPARTATVTKIPCGQQTNNNCPTPKPARKVCDRSSSPHGSKLPVRKPSFISSTTTPPAANSSPASNSRHPAASSKSLPANSNMGTAFQNMSKSGQQGGKHSKSTFGFGLRKPAASSNPKTKAGNKTNSLVTSLPESGSSSATTEPPAKPIKLGTNSAGVVVPAPVGITKTCGNGKDEGYSTMSSEALAEQEHHHNLRHNNSLEKSTNQCRGVALSRNSTFSVKPSRGSKNSCTITSPYSAGNKTVIGSAGSCSNTVAAAGCTLETDPVQPVTGGATRNSIHKSNTFNTFRELPSHRRLPRNVCDDEDDDEDNLYDSITTDSHRRLHSSRNNYNPAGSRLSHDTVTNGDNFPRNSSLSESSGQFTSLPTSSSSASSSPSKSKLSGRDSAASTNTTPNKRTLKSSYRKDRITATTRMMDGNIVRIVRGSPYSARLYGEDSGDEMDDEEDPSSSTILWEDSDDSDILFLPIEVSTGSAASSRSTLVPPPQSSGGSQSYYSSWGTGSSSMGTSNTYCSTLEKGSNSSMNTTTGGGGSCGGGGPSNSNTYSRRAYPLRRSKDEIEERALIEKWMQLEEVRNEQVQGGEQWAWDWDGVERTYTRVLRSTGMKRMPMEFHQEEEDDEEIDVDLILEESELPHPSEVDGLNSIEERNNAVNESDHLPCSQQFDSSTWTKSKSRKKESNKVEKRKDETANGRQSNNSQKTASPEKVRRYEGGIVAAALAEHQILLVLEGERDIENEAGLLIKPPSDVDCEDSIGTDPDKDGEYFPNKSHSTVINLDEHGMVVMPPRDIGGEATAEEEDDPPPVIEFTPEFYRLANFGSNLSFSDNESNVTSPNHSSTPASATTPSPKLITLPGNKSTGLSNSPGKGSPKKRKSRKPQSNSFHSSSVPVQTKTPTDDKISQTDFSCSSLENMSSVSSSELSTECRNCLDIIKKLVGQQEKEGEGCCSGEFSGVESENGAFYEDDSCGRCRQRQTINKSVDSGSYATTWISVPKGLPIAEVDRILEILSSSESEGVLSPSK